MNNRYTDNMMFC